MAKTWIPPADELVKQEPSWVPPADELVKKDPEKKSSTSSFNGSAESGSETPSIYHPIESELVLPHFLPYGLTQTADGKIVSLKNIPKRESPNQVNMKSNDSNPDPEQSALEPITEGLSDIAVSPATSAVHGIKEGVKEMAKGFGGGFVPTTLTGSLQTAEGIAKAGFGALNVVPQVALFTMGTTAAEKVVPEKYLNYVFAPLQTFIQPESEAGKAATGLADIGLNLLVIHGLGEIAKKIKTGEELTVDEVNQAGNAVGDSKPEEVQQAAKDLVVENLPPELAPIKEKEINLHNDANNLVPVMGEDAQKLFAPEIEKTKQEFENKKSEIETKQIVADKISQIEQAIPLAESTEAKKILVDELKKISPAAEQPETLTAAEESGIDQSTFHSKANEETKIDGQADQTEVLSEPSPEGTDPLTTTGGEPGQPSESAIEPPVVKKSKINTDDGTAITPSGKQLKISLSKNSDDIGEYVTIRAKDNNGRVVGTAKFIDRGSNRLEGSDVQVPEKEQRQGIGTTLYDYAERSGYEIKPSILQTPEGKALWKSRSGKIQNVNTESNAIQEPSASSVLQHPQEAAPEAGSGRERVEPSEQGNEAAETRNDSSGKGASEKEVEPGVNVSVHEKPDMEYPIYKVTVDGKTHFIQRTSGMNGGFEWNEVKKEKSNWFNVNNDTHFSSIGDTKQEAINSLIHKIRKDYAPPFNGTIPTETTSKSAQAYSGSPKIKTEAEPEITKPVKASDIIKTLSEKLGVPIRTGHVRWGKRLGVFKPHEEVVRNKEGNDLAVASHEVTHFIDKKFSPDLKNAEYRDELKSLDYDQQKRRPFEGFAEFVRHYLTDDDAAQLAPKFHDYFENTFLKDHPALEKTLSVAKKEIDSWRKQGAEARMISEIDWDGSGKRNVSLGEWTRRARTRWIDSLGGLKYAMNEMLGDKVKDLRPSENPVSLASAGNKRASAVARSWVMDGMTNVAGEKISKSLKEIVAPVVDEIKSAIAYTRALRIENRSKQDGDFNPNVLEDAKSVIEKYKDNKEFNQFAKEVTQWNASMIDYLADAGRISPELKKKILDSDLVYIPFKHAIEQSTMGGGSGLGKSLLNLGIPVKRFNKRGGDIVNPLETMMQNAEKIISTADKNRVVNSLVDIAEKNDGLGKWVEEIATPQTAITTGIKKLKSQLEGLGADLSDADMDGMLTLFSQSPAYLGKENIGVVYRNGKPKFYEFDPELFQALKGMDQANINWFTHTLLGKAATGVTKAVRLGATGLRAGFQLISNPIRDTWTASLQSQYHSASQPFRSVKGIIDALGNSESHRMFKALGGEAGQPLGVDRRFTQDLTREILADDAKSKAMNVIKSPVEMLRKVISFTEAGVRMGEFKAVVKKYQPKIDEALRNGDLGEVKKLKEDRAIEAANAANEVTVDFKRMGSYSSALNQIIFGFNPAVQGLSKMGRTIAERPVRSTLRGVAYLTAPTLALWALNKDEEWYKQLKPWERYAFWHFKIGDTIYKLPKPFEWGYIFGGIPEGITNSLYHDDNYYIKTALQQTAVQLVPNVIPDAVKTPAELYFNWDMYRDQPVVPPSEENLLPPLQYTPSSSSLAKEAGELLNVAPVKIDFLLNGYTGGLAGDILNGFHKDYKEKSDIPVVGRLFLRQSDELLNGDYVQRFYDLADKSLKIHQSVKVFPKMKENATVDEMKKTLHLNDEGMRLYSNYENINKIKGLLQDMRAAQKKIELMKATAEFKSRLLNELGSAAVKLVTPIVESGKSNTPAIGD